MTVVSTTELTAAAVISTITITVTIITITITIITIIFVISVVFSGNYSIFIANFHPAP